MSQCKRGKKIKLAISKFPTTNGLKSLFYLCDIGKSFTLQVCTDLFYKQAMKKIIGYPGHDYGQENRSEAKFLSRIQPLLYTRMIVMMEGNSKKRKGSRCKQGRCMLSKFPPIHIPCRQKPNNSINDSPNQCLQTRSKANVKIQICKRDFLALTNLPASIALQPLLYLCPNSQISQKMIWL